MHNNKPSPHPPLPHLSGGSVASQHVAPTQFLSEASNRTNLHQIGALITKTKPPHHLAGSVAFRPQAVLSADSIAPATHQAESSNGVDIPALTAISAPQQSIVFPTEIATPPDTYQKASPHPIVCKQADNHSCLRELTFKFVTSRQLYNALLPWLQSSLCASNDGSLNVLSHVRIGITNSVSPLVIPGMENYFMFNCVSYRCRCIE